MGRFRFGLGYWSGSLVVPVEGWHVEARPELVQHIEDLHDEV